MAKEVLLYTPIYDYSAEKIITALESYKGEDITLRINSDGGSPESSYGIIAKLKEHKGKVDMQIDGRARSMAAFLPAYATGKVTALDTTEFLIHRAAYPSWVENDTRLMTDARKTSLNNVNADLRAAFGVRVNADKFQELTGKSMDDVFSLENRIDVVINASQALEMGLIDEIVNITPAMSAEIESNGIRLAAEYSGFNVPAVIEATPRIPSKSNNHNKMNLQKLLAEHPELYAEVKQLGVAEERDRVGALMAFADVDLEAVSKAIEDGSGLTQKLSAEFTRKAISKGALTELAANGAPAVETGDAQKEDEAKVSAEEASFWDEVRTKTGRKTLKNN